MKRTREFRRFQHEKKLNLRRKILKSQHLCHSTPEGVELIARKECEHTSKKCQCCCNPRHSSLYKAKERITIQERKANIGEAEFHFLDELLPMED